MLLTQENELSGFVTKIFLGGNLFALALIDSGEMISFIQTVMQKGSVAGMVIVIAFALSTHSVGKAVPRIGAKCC